ncbi:Rhomboid-like protein 15 [Citrus sinensis]|uniref:Rhomboid-like protein 15 n=1 Tax=Citrus sinensis TaxID=2711 RepID=A0ACB8JZ84_CITSI|nr:Rhomboid-like protein 15 [Citrus sinensis]
MLALVPLGSELERIMGSVRMFYITILLATSNAILHLLIALLVAHIPFYRLQNVMDECAIGFSGVIFSLIVIETSLSGAQSRSVFGLFNIPAKWYPLILLVLFQVLMTNVSLLGHLCGILSGFAYTYGFFNLLMPGTSFYSAIESSSLLSTCIRRPKFILCTGGNPSGYIPTYSGQNTSSSGLFSGNIWSNLSSWMPQRETSSQITSINQSPLTDMQPTQDSRFPGRGRTLSSSQSPVHVDSNLQARLLDNSSPENRSHMIVTETGDRLSDERQPALGTAVAVDRVPAGQQGAVVSDEEIQKLVSMGFDKTQVEVALAAADGDLNVAVEILSQQVHSRVKFSKNCVD